MAELRFDVYDGETATIREYVLRLRSTESIHFMALNVFDDNGDSQILIDTRHLIQSENFNVTEKIVVPRSNLESLEIALEALPIVFDNDDQTNFNAPTEAEFGIIDGLYDLPEIGEGIEPDEPAQSKKQKKVPNREGITLDPALVDAPRRQRKNVNYDVGSAIKEKYETYDQLQKKALDAGQENASRRRRLDTHAAEQRKLFEELIGASAKVREKLFLRAITAEKPRCPPGGIGKLTNSEIRKANRAVRWWNAIFELKSIESTASRADVAVKFGFEIAEFDEFSAYQLERFDFVTSGGFIPDDLIEVRQNKQR